MSVGGLVGCGWVCFLTVYISFCLFEQINLIKMFEFY